MAEIGLYKMGGDVATKDKLIIGTKYDLDQMHELIKAIRPAASDEVANLIEASKVDKTVWISKAFGIIANNKGQHQLVDATEVLGDFTFFVAGQAEEMFAVGGSMLGARLRLRFPGVQMGRFKIDGKPFVKCTPRASSRSPSARRSSTGSSSSSCSTS